MSPSEWTPAATATQPTCGRSPPVTVTVRSSPAQHAVASRRSGPLRAEKDGVLRYQQLVPEVSQEPNYDEALTAVKKLL